MIAGNRGFGLTIDRQVERDGCAAPLLAGYGKLPAMHFGKGFRKGEPKAGAFMIAVRARTDLFKRLRQSWKILFRNADTIIRESIAQIIVPAR